MERRESECGGWGRRKTRKMHRALIHENDARSTLARVYTRVHKAGMPDHARSPLVKEHEGRSKRIAMEGEVEEESRALRGAPLCRLLFSRFSS